MKRYFDLNTGKPSAQLLVLVGLVFLGYALSIVLQSTFLSGWAIGSPIQKLFSALLSQLCTFFLPVIIFVRCGMAGGSKILNLDLSLRKWFLAFVGFVIMVLMIPLSDMLTAWNNSWTFGSLDSSLRQAQQTAQDITTSMLSLTSSWGLAVTLFLIALVPAVCEELFFRCSIQQLLSRIVGNENVSVFVTALLFSLAHGDLYGLLPRFVLGLVLGYLFVKGGSLLINVVAHFSNNAIVVIMYYLYNIGVLSLDPTLPLSLSWFTILLCTVSVVVLGYVYFVADGGR